MKETVKNIYMDANIPQSDNSVYKIEEIKKVIPVSRFISKADKKSIIIGMLDVMKVNITDIHKDAELRTKALSEADVLIRAEGAEKIVNLKQSITGLEAQIKEYRNDLATAQIELRDKSNALDAETMKINSLVNYII